MASATGTNEGSPAGAGNAFGSEVKTVYFRGNMTVEGGGIRNQGDVSATANAKTEADAKAFHLNGNVTGGFSNDDEDNTIAAKMIAATAVAEDEMARADGIYVGGTFGGYFSNAETVSASATSSEMGATARAVSLNGAVTTGTAGEGITNAGALTAVATAKTEADAKAYYIDDDLEGDFSNSGTGTITATATSAEDEATADSVYVSGFMTGNITNSGTITATATSTADEATADSVYVSGAMTGNITNSGTLTATASADLAATANALKLGGTFEGHLLNAETVSASATSSEMGATARAVSLNGAVTTGTAREGITNAGALTAVATAKTEADAKAYYIDDDLEGDFSNSGTGTITATATSAEDEATADSVYVSGAMTGNITNSGTLTATASADLAATANALKLGGTFEGHLLNAETVSASATSSEMGATARAVSLNGAVTTGTAREGITNAGALTAVATAKTEADAKAYYIDDDLEGDFSNSGTGTITATATSAEDEATADSVYVSGAMTGNITNSGTLTATASADLAATANALKLGGTFEGHLLNAETVSASATSSEMGATARAVSLNGAVTTGTAGEGITNAGALTAVATAKTEADAKAYYIDDDLTGDFSNSGTGTITATATSAEDEATADSVYVSGAMTGNITNSGTLTATASADLAATANALKLGGTFEGHLLNAETVSASATSSEMGATARAVSLNGAVTTGTAGEGITNAGALTAVATAKTEADAKAYYIDDDLTGDFSNSGTGTITATATSAEDEATADSVYVSGAMTGNITNSDDITATATAKATATARAWYINDVLNGNFANAAQGTITATAASSEGEAVAHGVYLTEHMGEISNAGTITVMATGATEATARGLDARGTVAADGIIRNTGMISATADAPEGGAYGIYVGQSVSGGIIENSGTITVEARKDADAYGIYVANHDGVIDDLGTILASSENRKAYAVYLGEGSGRLRVDTEDRIGAPPNDKDSPYCSVLARMMSILTPGAAARFSISRMPLSMSMMPGHLPRRSVMAVRFG